MLHHQVRGDRPQRSHVRLTPHEKQGVTRTLLSGASRLLIAAQFKLSKSAASAICCDLAGKVRTIGEPIPLDLLPAIRRMRRSGAHWKVIAKVLGYPMSSIFVFANKYEGIEFL